MGSAGTLRITLCRIRCSKRISLFWKNFLLLHIDFSLIDFHYRKIRFSQLHLCPIFCNCPFQPVQRCPDGLFFCEKRVFVLWNESDWSLISLVSVSITTCDSTKYYKQKIYWSINCCWFTGCYLVRQFWTTWRLVDFGFLYYYYYYSPSCIFSKYGEICRHNIPIAHDQDSSHVEQKIQMHS